MASYNPNLLKAALQYGREYNIDPALLIATTIVESGGRLDAVGDNGGSFGPYQMYKAGRLKSAGFTPQQAMDPFLSTRAAAQEFATFAKRGYKGAELAVNAQRPADRAGYMRKINAALPQAQRYLKGLGGAADAALLNAPIESAGGGEVTAPQVPAQQGKSMQDMILSALQNRNQAGGTAKALRAEMVAQMMNEQPDSTGPMPAPNEGSFNGSPGTLKQAQSAARVEGWAKGQVGKPYIWGSGHGKLSEYAGYDCSGFVSQVLMRAMPGKYKSSGTTMTLFPKMKGRPASPDAPIAIGFRGMGKGARGEHMGIRINGTWYSAGGRGNKTVVVGDSNWDHVLLP